MTGDTDRHVERLLTHLERIESRLLAWGVVDGGFSSSELATLADEFVAERGLPSIGVELIEALQDRHLLFGLAGRRGRVYRTRMAETMRLFANLRQIFPNRSWRVAPRLVADYRFSVIPRAYPKRELSTEEVLELLAEEVQLSPLETSALKAVLSDGDRETRLAEFQLRATRRMLQDLGGNRSRAMVIGAGTGAGKTLAFYLPALTHLATLVEADANWTKAIAIYPRNELLKDQLQSALAQVRKVSKVLDQRGDRGLLVGAYFGPTPNTNRHDHVAAKWRKRGSSFVCPYLRCPECGDELVWKEADREADLEQLWCQGCGHAVREDEVILTRRRMEATPPDLLFTTTETLNRRLADIKGRRVFGVGTSKSPRVLLLDEIHTYEGVHGAQVAYLVRRWRHAVDAPIHICGLSATLENAADFFSTLTGLPVTTVEGIEPRVEDLEEQGVEYQTAVRADPASGASLLSTTIQTVMLMRRVLDSADTRSSQGLFGTRVYAFTDDLDVTNRLYHNLLDAEGRTAWGAPKNNGVVLASLRTHTAEEARERLIAGQSWLIPEEIQAPVGLDRSLVVGRTSSQDSGVNADADVIVATASLEVGFDDPEAGAVVQHKAPFDAASFLQRKGRAGRDRHMRPWTVVVLSDYGRDRLAYQSYDQLFDPTLQARSLPVGNRHVLKMQAVYAFMDWIAAELSSNHTWGSMWRDFSAPVGRASGATAARRTEELRILQEILVGGPAEARLQRHLQSALQVSDDEIQAILWQAPRGLLTAVIPTLVRRLETDWRRVPAGQESVKEPHKPYAPLPEFVPENLFSDLNLPEVVVRTPPEFEGDQPYETAMPVLQAMRTFTPGRASRRFGIRSGRATHWIAPSGWAEGGPPQDSPSNTLPVSETVAEYDYLGSVQYLDDQEEDTVRSVSCYRPRLLTPRDIPQQVLPSTNAFPIWKSQILSDGEGTELQVPRVGPWSSLIVGATAYTHSHGAHAEVRRFSIGSSVSLRTRRGGTTEYDVRYVGGEAPEDPAALGFKLEVDGIQFRLNIPGNLETIATGPKRRALITAYLRETVLASEHLAALANRFQRQWLQQVYLTAVVAHAISEGSSIQKAAQDLAADDELPQRFANVLQILFQSLSYEQGQENNEGQESSDLQRVHSTLLELIQNREVLDALRSCGKVLWDPPEDDWKLWLEQRLRATFGGAVIDAARKLRPQIQDGDLLLDLEPGPRVDGRAEFSEVWVTEAAMGGAGHVEGLLQDYAHDPRRFFHLVQQALEATDLELVSAELDSVVDLAINHNGIRSAFAATRRADTLSDFTAASSNLKLELSANGVLPAHAVVAAVHTRLLRPGSSPASDDVVADLVRKWRSLEETLGVEVDARIFAYIASGEDSLSSALQHVESGYQHDRQWRFQTIFGLLWPRGHEVRSNNLKVYNPFVDLPAPERELLKDIVDAGLEEIRLGGDDWRSAVADALGRLGSVRLKAPLADAGKLRSAIHSLIATPIELGFLHLYPQVRGVHRTRAGIAVDLYLREALQ